MIPAALKVVSNGWPIIPIHDTAAGYCSCRKKSNCPNAGKHPRLVKWTQKASIDPEQIRKWWDKYPDANIGIVTGLPSGLVVLDFDLRSDGEVTLHALRELHPEIWKTYRVKTGSGGWHLYFQRPESGAKTGAGILTGMDVRGDGGMVVAAGSTHKSGGQYRVDFAGPVLPLPGDLMQHISGRTQEGHKSNTRTTQEQRKNNASNGGQHHHFSNDSVSFNLDAANQKQKEQIIRAFKNSIPDQAGVRNKHVFQLGRRLMAVDGIDSKTNPESLRPIVKLFYGELMAAAAKHKFTVNGSFAETMDEFRYAWARIHTPMDDIMGQVVERCTAEITTDTLPDQVQQCLEAVGYDDDDESTAALVLLCWHLDQHWQPVPFFLSARAGAKALEQIGVSKPLSFQKVSYRLKHLERDGVIGCTQRSKPGQRGAASEFVWTWTQPPEPAAKLDWLPRDW